MAKLMNIGFGNMVASSRLIAIVSPESAPIKRIVQDSRERGALIDATCGRKTRTVIIMDSDATQGRRTKSVIFTENNKIILSALQPETLAGRFNGNASEGDYDTKE